MKRRWGLLTYAGVKEEGSQSGMKHLHFIIVFAARPLQSAVSALWRKLTGAFMINMKVIGHDRVDQYLAKYLAKGHRIARKDMMFARNWPKLPPLPQPLDVTKFLNPPAPGPNRISMPDGSIIELPYTPCPCDLHDQAAYVHSILLARLSRHKEK